MHPKEWLELIEDTVLAFEAGKITLEMLSYVVMLAAKDLNINECAEKLKSNPRLVVRCFRDVVNELTKFNIFISTPENVIYTMLKKMIESGEVDVNKLLSKQDGEGVDVRS